MYRNIIDDYKSRFLTPVFNENILQFVKYFFVGGFAALFDWFLYWFILSYSSIYYLLAALISFTVATLINYLLSIRWVFESKKDKRLQEVFLIFLFSGVGLLLNEVILFISVDYILLDFMLGKVLATALVFFWNYYIRKKLIFKRG